MLLSNWFDFESKQTDFVYEYDYMSMEYTFIIRNARPGSANGEKINKKWGILEKVVIL